MKLNISKHIKKNRLLGKVKNTAIDVQTLELEDARHGAIYFLAHIEVKRLPQFSTNIIGNFIAGTEPLYDAKAHMKTVLERTNTGKKIVGAVTAIGESAQEVLNKITTLISDFIQNLIKNMRHRYGEIVFAAGWVSEFVTWVIAEFAGNIAMCIPGWGYVQNASELYSGVKEAILKSKDFFSQFYEGRGVQLLGGHPSIIANSLLRHSMAGVMRGLKVSAVSITKIGLQAAGDAFSGVGFLVNALVGIFERLLAVIDWLVQLSLIDSVLKRARREWSNRTSMNALMNNHQLFSEWFQKVVIQAPVIAALVMGSGFTAHPYRFLQLISPCNKIKSRADFEKGVSYIEKLKTLSSSYIQEYSTSYCIEFKSHDKLVEARLAELKTGQGILHNLDIGGGGGSTSP
jgi:hypothetical protein